MSDLANSYHVCHTIARRSGSNFFRSFGLLSKPRRDAMTALYAFARLADDATDDCQLSSQVGAQMAVPHWNASLWHEWLDQLVAAPDVDRVAVENQIEDDRRIRIEALEPIGLALRHSVHQFAIPIETLHDMVSGVDMDTTGPVRLENWDQTQRYCYQVASSVGVACLAIWSKKVGEAPNAIARQAALDCGVAFQLTNILRDLVEDSQRGRIYVPTEDLGRYGIPIDRWLQMGGNPNAFALNEIGDWKGLIRLYVERAKAHYELGWRVVSEIALDGQRMFSLMWHTYRELLDQIERAPEAVWQGRVGLTAVKKAKLLANHVVTPFFHRTLAKNKSLLTSDWGVTRTAWPQSGLRVAVIGAGLAGINAALHLARHGAKVTLIESKNRMGGRVGSFVDSGSGHAIDYCQHVGMYCCKTLLQWIEDTNQKPNWIEQDSLYFASAHRKRIQIKSWPLPAPFHLSGLLLKWPGLKWMDRVRVASALLKLLRLDRQVDHSQTLAIDWLRQAGQNETCIKNFWATILVSALGEQVDRVTLGATHKVLVDGFAADRRAFHLMVPNLPLSEILDRHVTKSLEEQGVQVVLGNGVKKFERNQQGLFQLERTGSQSSSPTTTAPAWANEPFDAVVCAVPWHTIESMLPADLQTSIASGLCSPQRMDSSPITGIHTWWDRPWLKEPHAILIDRLCQWVFPAPEGSDTSSSGTVPSSSSAAGVAATGAYYQIVISGSRTLPRGDPETVLKWVKQDLAEIFPESAVATLFRGKVVTDPNAVFSVSPGHESSRLTANKFAEHGIWLAGDWTMTHWPATMEGALISGAKSAEGVLAGFGRASKLA